MIIFENYPEISKQEIKAALDFCGEQIIGNLPEFTEQFQNAYSVTIGPVGSGRERYGWPMSTPGTRGCETPGRRRFGAF